MLSTHWIRWSYSWVFDEHLQNRVNRWPPVSPSSKSFNLQIWGKLSAPQCPEKQPITKVTYSNGDPYTFFWLRESTDKAPNLVRDTWTPTANGVPDKQVESKECEKCRRTSEGAFRTGDPNLPKLMNKFIVTRLCSWWYHSTRTGRPGDNAEWLTELPRRPTARLCCAALSTVSAIWPVIWVKLHAHRNSLRKQFQVGKFKFVKKFIWQSEYFDSNRPNWSGKALFVLKVMNRNLRLGSSPGYRHLWSS